MEQHEGRAVEKSQLGGEAMGLVSEGSNEEGSAEREWYSSMPRHHPTIL